jgi:hypothetical protein
MSYASTNGPPTSTQRHIRLRLRPNEGHRIPLSGETGHEWWSRHRMLYLYQMETRSYHGRRQRTLSNKRRDRQHASSLPSITLSRPETCSSSPCLIGQLSRLVGLTLDEFHIRRIDASDYVLSTNTFFRARGLIWLHSLVASGSALSCPTCPTCPKVERRKGKSR